MSLIYISHDMAVIAEVSHVVGVMYAGRIVEWGETVDIFRNPMHPYTQTLMSAFPSVTGPKHELAMLAGEPPNLLNPPSGCRFHPRCPAATDVCRVRRAANCRRLGHALGGLLAPAGGVGGMAISEADAVAVGTKPLIKVEGLQKRFPSGLALVPAQSQLRARGGRDLVRPGARRELWA